MNQDEAKKVSDQFRYSEYTEYNAIYEYAQQIIATEAARGRKECVVLKDGVRKEKGDVDWPRFCQAAIRKLRNVDGFTVAYDPMFGQIIIFWS